MNGVIALVTSLILSLVLGPSASIAAKPPAPSLSAAQSVAMDDRVVVSNRVAIPAAANTKDRQPKCRAATSSKVIKPFRPTNRIIGNKPANKPSKVNDRQQHAITLYVADVINAAPCTAEIYMGMFSLNTKKTYDAFSRAWDRGASVRFMSWQKYVKSKGQTTLPKPSRQVTSLVKKLGQNQNLRSYAKVCRGSCYTTGNNGEQHPKLITVSNVIAQKVVKVKQGKRTVNKVVRYRVNWVVISSSGNMTNAAGYDSWNEAIVIVGNKKIYDAAKQYLYEMRRDKTDYTHPNACSGKYCIYFSPFRTDKNDKVLQAIAGTRCTGVRKKGYGSRGRTVIRIPMFIWTSNDAKLANVLVQKKRQGCDIGVMGDLSNWGLTIGKRFLKAKIPLWNARNRGVYLHSKATIIDGIVRGRYVKFVFSGSTNRSASAKTVNADQIVLVNDAAYVRFYIRRYNMQIREGYAKRIWTVAQIPRKPRK